MCMLPLTCSYDEMLRVWDTRSLAQPVAKHATGGGVWRIKPHPQDPTLLLLAAMYNSFHVLKWDIKHSSSKTPTWDPFSYNICHHTCDIPDIWIWDLHSGHNVAQMPYIRTHLAFMLELIIPCFGVLCNEV